MLMQNLKGRGAQPAGSSQPPATKGGQSHLHKPQMITTHFPTFSTVFDAREETANVDE
jgi:hypothetical protein